MELLRQWIPYCLGSAVVMPKKEKTIAGGCRQCSQAWNATANQWFDRGCVHGVRVICRIRIMKEFRAKWVPWHQNRTTTFIFPYQDRGGGQLSVVGVRFDKKRDHQSALHTALKQRRDLAGIRRSISRVTSRGMPDVITGLTSPAGSPSSFSK